MAIVIKERSARTILVRSRLPGIDYVINPYLGCVHGCAYCYANFMKKFGLHKEDWGKFCDIKINAPQLLAREMKKAKPGNILLSSVTDPYNPLENKYKLTRQILEILLNYQWPVDILTKSSLVVRDIDLLRDFKNLEVGFSFFSVDNKDIKNFEEHSALPEDRLRAIKQLTANHISVYAFIAPILPHITNLPDIFRELHQTEVKSVLLDSFNYKTGGRGTVVLDIVKNRYPNIWSKFREDYANPAYWKNLKNEVYNLARQHQLEVKVFF